MEIMDTSYDEFFDAFEGGDGNQTGTTEDVEEAENTEETAEEVQDEPENDETAGEVTEGSAEKDGVEGNDKGDGGGSEQKFTIKVNKQDMELTLPQMTEYAQKGADYDRVKGQLEASRQNEQALQTKLGEQQEAMDILNMISEQTGTPMAELLEQLHINAVKKDGQTDAEVKAQIRADKLERQLKAKNEQQTQQKVAEDEAATRMQREVADFRKQFPDVQLTEELASKLKPDIQAGMSITSAYLKMENARKDAELAALKRQQAADAQNNRNRSKAPGSQRDSGGQRGRDEFDDFFDAFEK